ncbi:MAG: PKD domain-containing protein, partial [Anaerolineae bacterium]
PRVMNLYVADRGVDNNSDPLENDGRIYELYVPAPTADVTLVKTVEPAAAVPGQTIAYTLAFRNAGNDTAGDVTITDIIPPEVTVQSVYSSGVTVVNSGQSPPYVWEVQDLTTADEGVIVVTGEVDPALDCFDPFTNLATIATTSADARSGNDSSSVALAAGAGVSVNPSSHSKPANQGQNVIYTLRVTNEGSCADTFDVSVSGTDWPVLVQSPVALNGGAARDVQVTVQVPSNAPCGPESAIITFTSRGASEISASSELVTSVNPVYAATVAPPTDTRIGFPGDVVTYTLRLTNTGNCLETFDLSASEPNWMSSFPSTVGPLYTGLGLDVDVVVTVPPDALATDQDVTTMTFASQGNGATLANSILTTSVDVLAGVDVGPSVTTGSGDPGAFAVYTLWVTNTGSFQDTFTFSATGDQWPASAQPTSVTLDPAQAASVQVTVAVPPGAQCSDSDSSVVTFTSQNDGTVSDSSLLATSANPVPALAVTPASAPGWAEPGSAAVYSLQVTNLGNCRDTYDFSATGDQWPASAQPSAVTLDPDQSAPVQVTVAVPSAALCTDNDSATVTFTSREDVAVSDSSILTTRANAVYGVTVAPSSSTASGDPGADATHNLLVTNIGNCQDTFTFSASGDDWPASTQSSTVTLDPAQSAPVPVTVAVPAGARCVDSDSAAVTFTSQNDGAVFGRSTLTTSANPVSALTAVPSTDTRSAAPGSDADYSLSLTNDGNCIDTFTIDAVGDTWPASALPTRVELDPGQTTPVQVTVAVPASAQCGTDVATVTFTSNDGTASTTSILTTSASAVRGVSIEPPSEALSGDPGAPVVYSLSVTNDGNCVDTFTFSTSGNAWTTSAPSVGPLGPGASANVDVTVTVDPDVLCNEQDSATITFASAADGTTSNSSVLTTMANPVYGVTVTPPSTALSGDPGDGVVYTLWVTNTGNCTDSFIRSISGHTWPPSAPPFVGPLAPDAGESVDVTVPVPVCTEGGVSDSATVTFESQHDGTVADGASLTTTANNAAPVASDDPYGATEDVPLAVTAPGLLDNDDDANCTSLGVSQYSQPSNGTVVVNGDGSFTYTPAPNFYGIDSFTYHASDGNLTSTATVTITVESAYDDPVVDAGPDLPQIGDPAIKEGDTVSFEGTVDDPQQQSLLAGESIHWDFGDGNTATGTLTPNHTYLDNDEYTVTLTITDTEGDAGQDWLTVKIENVVPVVYAGPDQSAVPGETLSFSGVYTDTEADTLTIRWDLSDGTVIHDLDSFDHAFEATGNYTVSLTVTDDDAGVGIDYAIVSVRHKVYLPLVFRNFGP